MKNGRVQGKELLPNQETAMKFTFRVKEPSDTVNFEIQIFDGQMHDLWRDKISVNTARLTSTKTRVRALNLKLATASLLERPDPKSNVIATLREGVWFESQKEINDYLLVKVNNDLTGFIKKSDVKDAPSGTKPPQNNAQFYSINYNRVPAHVTLTFGDGSGITSSDSGKVLAEIKDVHGLASLLLYVNGKKVLYKDIARSVGKEKLEQPGSLKTWRKCDHIVFARCRRTTTYTDNVRVLPFSMTKMAGRLNRLSFQR